MGGSIGNHMYVFTSNNNSPNVHCLMEINSSQGDAQSARDNRRNDYCKYNILYMYTTPEALEEHKLAFSFGPGAVCGLTTSRFVISFLFRR